MADCTPLQQTLIDGDGNEYQVAVPPLSLTPIDIDAETVFPLTLQAAVAGMLTRLYRVYLTVSAACTIGFVDGASEVGPRIVCQPGEVIILDQGIIPWAQGSPDTDFKINTLVTSGSVTITGTVWINLNAT